MVSILCIAVQKLREGYHSINKNQNFVLKAELDLK